jgi:hypothetical protein
MGMGEWNDCRHLVLLYSWQASGFDGGAVGTPRPTILGSCARIRQFL